MYKTGRQSLLGAKLKSNGKEQNQILLDEDSGIINPPNPNIQ